MSTARRPELAAPSAIGHPNGTVGIDQLVITTGDFDRTMAVFAARGMPSGPQAAGRLRRGPFR